MKTWSVIFNDKRFTVDAESYEKAELKALEVLKETEGYIPYSVRLKHLIINLLKS